jgi:PAS domain S-box-containing protein
MSQRINPFSFRRLLDALPEVVLALDGEERILYASAGTTRWLGWSADELQGEPLSSTLAPEEDGRAAANSPPESRSGPRRQRIRRRDGSRSSFDVDILPAPSGIEGAAELRVLRPSRNDPLATSSFPWGDPTAAALLDHLPVGVMAFDDQGVCRAANRAATRFLIADRGQLVGRSAEDFPLPNNFLFQALWRCIAARVTYVQTASPWELQGVRRYYDWRFEPLALGDPKSPAGALVVVLDVTERTHGELALQQAVTAAESASRRKTQFLSAISHDLRTPANALSLQTELMLQLIEMTGQPLGEIVELGADMRKVVNTLMELLNDLLDLSRFDSGQIDDRPTTFNVDDWLEASLAPLEATAHARGVDFTWRVDRPGRVIRADRVKLTRLLVNLASNAVKFTESGAIDVTVRMADDGGLTLRVVDTGTGIPADKLEHVFDEFAQLRNPERDRSKGTGLGLAICRRLVEGVGGRLTVESRVGEGSCFMAQYPPAAVSFEEHRIASRPPRTDPRTHRGSASVLLVEDDALTRSTLARLLQHAGYIVASASTAEEVFALLEREKLRPDLVLLDLLLPGMEGGQLLQLLRQSPEWSSLPVALLTGESLSGRTGDFLALNVDAILVKPVDIDQLLATVSRLLATRAAKPRR